jgi:23S rRNA pseudouridine2605 synthase
VRRIFEALGYTVEKLDRTAYAGLDKKELPRGHWRYLKPEEVVLLKHMKK